MRFAILVLLLSALPASAGIYSTNEPCPFNIRPDGFADELSFKPDKSGRFKPELAKYELILNPEKSSPDREAVLARCKKEQPVSDKAADLIRLGKLDDALNLLEPRTRDRVPDFRVLANLAHVYAARGDWNDAVAKHRSAWLDAEFPSELPGTTAAQRKWLQRVEKEFYPRWLQAHREQAQRKSPADAEDVLPLFPVKFQNENGEYEPGKLAASEKAKLPPDAIAIVQQLLLWSPTDTQLLWLLAELYAADGRVREAAVLFGDCIWSRSFSNRKLLMAHRDVVRQLVEKLPAEGEAALVIDVPVSSPEPAKRDGTLEDAGLSKSSLIGFAVVFGAIVLFFAGLQIRAIRKHRHNCGTLG